MTTITTADLTGLLNDINTIDDVVESNNPTTISKDGKTIRTLAGMNADADTVINDISNRGDNAIDDIETRGDAAILDIETRGDAAILDIETRGDAAIDDFNENGQTAIDNLIYVAGYQNVGAWAVGKVVQNAQETLTYNGEERNTTAGPFPVTVDALNPTDDSEDWYNVTLEALKTAMISLNQPLSAGTYDTAGGIVAKYIYSPSQQKTYSVPSDAIGKIIVSVVGSTLNTTVGGPYTLVSVTAVKESRILSAIDAGVIYSDILEAASNTQKLIAILAITDSILIDMYDDLFLEPLPLNDTSLAFKNVYIGGRKDKTLTFTTAGTVFTIQEGGNFYQNGVTVTTTSSDRVEVVTTQNGSDVRLTSLVCDNSNLSEYLRYGIGLANSATQDPAVKTNGADLISFSKNNLKNCDYGALWIINAMYDKLIVSENSLTDCKGAIIDNSMQNATVKYEEVKRFKKSASFTKNTLINGIDFFADSTAAGNIYAVIALSEGNYSWYDGNYCKNLQVKAVQTIDACNDFYYLDEKSEIGKNTVVNRFHWGVIAQSNPFVNCCIKIKAATNWSCSGYDHFYEEGYFDYQVANNGVSLTGIQGDFLAIEHDISAGAANIINVDGVRLHSRVLKAAPRDAYFSETFVVTGGVFTSEGTGYTEMCRAKSDAAVTTSFTNIYNVSNNDFNLPNGSLQLVVVAPTASQTLEIKCTGNSGHVKELLGNSVGQAGGIVAITKYEQDRNNFDVNGTKVGLISKNAVMPVMQYISLNDNIISAPDATEIDSLFGGVVSTAVQCSASCRFTVGLQTSIPLDTITGADAAQPMASRKGQRIIKGILYDTDFSAFGIEYPFEIQYTVDGESQSYTEFNILDSLDAFTTIRSDVVSTTSVKVTTTHPNMTAEVTSGVIGSNIIQLTLALGAGTSKRVIDVKHIKVSV